MKTTLAKLKSNPGIRWAWSMRNELLIGVIVLIAFINLGGWLRKIDGTAAPLDIGILTAPAVGIVGIVAAVWLFWTLWKFCFPDEIDRWFDAKDGFLRDFNNASPATRLFVFFGTLWTVILGVGMITMALR
jgi:hypothetical protein